MPSKAGGKRERGRAGGAGCIHIAWGGYLIYVQVELTVWQL